MKSGKETAAYKHCFDSLGMMIAMKNAASCLLSV